VDPTRHSHSLFFFHTFVPVPSLLCFFPTSTASQPGSPPARRTQDLHRRAGPPSPLSTLTSPVRHSGGSIAPARHLRPSASSPPRRSMARRAPPPRAPAVESSWRRRHSFHPCSRRPLSLLRRSGGPAAGSFPPSPPHMLRRRREEAGELVVRTSDGSPAPHRRRHLRRRICARHRGPPPLPLPARRGAGWPAPSTSWGRPRGPASAAPGGNSMRRRRPSFLP
jgi:hypothetical protein